MLRLLNFCKNEIVLSVAWMLAIISSFIVLPDAAYYSYIDYRTLSLLFCLMAIMAGLQEIGAFRLLAQSLLKRVRSSLMLYLVLVMLCFFLSMLITNDVALLTLVPFTLVVLQLLKKEQEWSIIIVTMQTIAANLGSMLTPLGNPQNLYLYSQAGMSFGEFIILMLPYTLLSGILLILCCVIYSLKNKAGLTVELPEKIVLKSHKKLIVYIVLFILSLLSIMHLLDYRMLLGMIIIAIGIMDKKILSRVDYTLLLTFIGFFIFIGNIGRISAFHDFLQIILEGYEAIVAVFCSQVISNVPAALLLSGFTDKYAALIIGTNLGGLGTLIASMASLISYKYIVQTLPWLKMRYLICFSILNVLFLIILLGLLWLIG